MSILIKGMEMPTSCWDCPCINGENGYCQLRKEYVYGEIPRSCPLVPVPPHGRLIDADALIAAHKQVCSLDMKFNLDLAPTIIPSDHKEERTVKWREWNTFEPLRSEDKEGET